MGIVRLGFNRPKVQALTCLEIECAVIDYFNPRVNLIVPNVSWGMFNYELDLLVLTPSGFAYEIEIKTNRADLIRDKGKLHGHRNSKIARLYFAIPKAMHKDIEHIPEHAGIIEVHDGSPLERGDCEIIRESKKNTDYVFTDKERYKIARLGTLRILGLKKTIRGLVKDINEYHKLAQTKSSLPAMGALSETPKLEQS
mgnify:CR=1 FL=1